MCEVADGVRTVKMSIPIRMRTVAGEQFPSVSITRFCVCVCVCCEWAVCITLPPPHPPSPTRNRPAGRAAALRPCAIWRHYSLCRTWKLQIEGLRRCRCHCRPVSSSYPGQSHIAHNLCDRTRFLTKAHQTGAARDLKGWYYTRTAATSAYQRRTRRSRVCVGARGWARAFAS